MQIKQNLDAIWTRHVGAGDAAGRPRVIQSIQAGMEKNFLVKSHFLSSFLEEKTPLRAAQILITTISELFSGRLPSLQCLLFLNWARDKEVLRTLAASEATSIYLDGVRTYYLIRKLKKAFPERRLVMDFDDLMSRRMVNLLSVESSLSLGYLRNRVPGIINRWLTSGTVSRAIARYEARALHHTERYIGQLANVIVLVSQAEGELLKSELQDLPRKAAVKVLVPPADLVEHARPYNAFSRFIFIGSDSLPQNRLSIEWIQQHWKEHSPTSEIHIYGSMTRPWEAVHGVTFRGFAKTLDEVYIEGSVLLAPGVLRGGVKTKVAEAFAYGCAVAGNEVTFEGMDIPAYPLCRPNQELAELIANPGSYLATFRAAAIMGQEYVTTCLNRKAYEESWKEILLGDAEQQSLSPD